MYMCTHTPEFWSFTCTKSILIVYLLLMYQHTKPQHFHNIPDRPFGIYRTGRITDFLMHVVSSESKTSASRCVAPSRDIFPLTDTTWCFLCQGTKAELIHV